MLINLHTHLEGTVRPGTAAQLGAAAGIPEPAGGWANALELDTPADLTTYLRKVASTYPLFASRESLARIACEAVEDAAHDGADYLELRFGPVTHATPDLDLDAVINAVCQGVSDGTRSTGLAAGVVVAALRHHEQHHNYELARAAARHAGSGVVGFDLAGDELRYPDIEPHRKPFAIAAAAGLGLTCHAAEAAPARVVLDAVNILHVSRIGHGAHIADDPAVMNWVAEHGIAIEICPTSNYYTGAISSPDRHPAPQFKTAGIPIVLGDDNPRQTRSPISAEYHKLSTVYGFTETDLQRLDADSIEHAFAEPSVRHRLRALFEQRPDPTTP